MFLDEKYINYCLSYKVISDKDFNSLIKGILDITVTELKDKVGECKTYNEIRSCYDRIFNSWDLALKTLTKENWVYSPILNSEPKFSLKDILFELYPFLQESYLKLKYIYKNEI